MCGSDNIRDSIREIGRHNRSDHNLFNLMKTSPLTCQHDAPHTRHDSLSPALRAIHHIYQVPLCGHYITKRALALAAVTLLGRPARHNVTARIGCREGAKRCCNPCRVVELRRGILLRSSGRGADDPGRPSGITMLHIRYTYITLLTILT